LLTFSRCFRIEASPKNMRSLTLLTVFSLLTFTYAVDPSVYKLVYPTLSLTSASTFNTSVDIIGPLNDDLISCSLLFGNNGFDDFGSPLVGTVSNVWTLRRPVSITSGYLYQLRLGALFTVAFGGSNPPLFVRADCTASSAPSSPFSTSALRLYGLSPSITTTGNITSSQFPSYTAGYPWGPFAITGLDLSPCNTNTIVSITFGGVDCIPWASNFPSPIGSAVAAPHCSTIIGVPTTTSPLKSWSIKCVASVLAGSRLPVVITISDRVTNATISSSPPDLSKFGVIPFQPSIAYVDVFSDQITSVSTRAQYGGSSVVTQAFDVPASPAKNSFGRVRVSFSAYGPCPRFDLRTNTTVLAAWNFTKSGGLECGAGALALTSGNAQLSPFPSSGFGNGTSLDTLKRRGYRIVLTDSIDAIGGYESYPIDSEIGGGKIMLLTYTPPVAVSVNIESISSTSTGPMGVSVLINVTGDFLGPLSGPFSNLPVITIGGKPCTNVVRTGARTLQAEAPLGIGSNLPLILYLGENTPSNTIFFSYPKPTIVSAEIVNGAEWDSAFLTTLSSPTPRLFPPSITSPSRGGPFPKDVILNVSEAGTGAPGSTSGDVVLLRGIGFGPWLGTGTLSTHSPDAAVWKTYTNSSVQCLALSWAGRGAGAAVPNCNGKWDYQGEGEMPSDGLVLWWSDSLIAFRVPPSSPGFREVVVSTGGGSGSGALQTTITSWWDYSVLLRYGLSDFRITSAVPNWEASTLGNGVLNISSTLSLSGPAFASPSSASLDPPLPLSSYSFPMTIPPTLAALAALPPLQFSMMVFQIGGSLGVDACAQTSASAGSAFAAVSSYLTQTVVPVSAKCAPAIWSTTGSSVTISSSGITSGTALIALPAGNGLNISVIPWLYDALPDRAIGNAIKVVRFSPDVAVGLFPSSSTNGKPQYSYASPRLSASGLSPRSISVNTWLSTVSKRLTVSLDLHGGAEETAGCSSGSGMPSMSLSVSFLPAQGGWDNPVGGLYTMTPTSGSILPKTKGSAPNSNCSSILGTFGFMPNLAVGRYGVRVTISSTAGVRIGETTASEGIAITCSSGFYGNSGKLCSSCVSGANCPGGNSSWDALDLSAPIYSPPGFWNFFGPYGTSCPPNTPLAQRPTGRDVCIAPCLPSAACGGANLCSSGYISAPPSAIACGKCDVGFARVNPSNCLAASYPTMISLNGTCVSTSTCNSASGIVWTSTGVNGENECVCSSGGTPPSSSPSPTNSDLPSTTPSGTASSYQTPSMTPTQTPTPSPTPTSSLSFGASSSNTPTGSTSPKSSASSSVSVTMSPLITTSSNGLGYSAPKNVNGEVDSSRVVIAVCFVVFISVFLGGLILWRLRSEGILCGWRCKSFATCCGLWPLREATLLKVKSWRPHQRKGQRRGANLLFGKAPTIGTVGVGGLSTRVMTAGYDTSEVIGVVNVANPVRGEGV
jgi:hypothetical protein